MAGGWTRVSVTPRGWVCQSPKKRAEPEICTHAPLFTAKLAMPIAVRASYGACAMTLERAVAWRCHTAGPTAQPSAHIAQLDH